MAISAEMLNTVLEDLRGPLVNAFATKTVLYDHLKAKKRVRMEGGTTIDRLHAGASPAKAKGIFAGDEFLPVQRTQISKRLSVEPHRIVVAIPIPKKELNRASGKAAAVRMVDHYVPAWVAGFAKDIETYLLTGAVSNVGSIDTDEISGLSSFYGPFTAGRNIGTTNGLLAHRTPAQQTSDALSVQSLVRSTAYHYYSHYDDIANWSTDGMKRLRRMQQRLAHWGGDRTKGADLVQMDSELFAVFDETRMNSVRIQMVGDKTENGTQMDIAMLGAQFINNFDVDRANLTGAAADGMATFLNTDWMEWVEITPLTIGKFEDRNDNQDVMTCKVEMDCGLIITKLIAQGVVTGGAA